MTEAVATLRGVSEYPGAQKGNRADTRTGDKVVSTATVLSGDRQVDRYRDRLGEIVQKASAGALIGTLSTVQLDVDPAVVCYPALENQILAELPRPERASALRVLWALRTPTSAWEPDLKKLLEDYVAKQRRDCASAIASAPHLAATHAPKPSEDGLRMLQRVRAAAISEVKAHLAAGREVSGLRDGKLVVVKPNK